MDSFSNFFEQKGHLLGKTGNNFWKLVRGATAPSAPLFPTSVGPVTKLKRHFNRIAVRLTSLQ